MTSGGRIAAAAAAAPAEVEQGACKDERLSPNSTDVINAWEQSIKQPSPGQITFNNGRVQIHRAQVKSPNSVQQVPKVHKVAQQPPKVHINKVQDRAKIQVFKQKVKSDVVAKTNCKLGSKKDVSHIAITGKPGLGKRTFRIVDLNIL